jgi:hypothetical protein
MTTTKRLLFVAIGITISVITTASAMAQEPDRIGPRIRSSWLSCTGRLSFEDYGGEYFLESDKKGCDVYISNEKLLGRVVKICQPNQTNELCHIEGLIQGTA